MQIVWHVRLKLVACPPDRPYCHIKQCQASSSMHVSQVELNYSCHHRTVHHGPLYWLIHQVSRYYTYWANFAYSERIVQNIDRTRVESPLRRDKMRWWGNGIAPIRKHIEQTLMCHALFLPHYWNHFFSFQTWLAMYNRSEKAYMNYWAWVRVRARCAMQFYCSWTLGGKQLMNWFCHVYSTNVTWPAVSHSCKWTWFFSPVLDV